MKWLRPSPFPKGTRVVAVSPLGGEPGTVHGTVKRRVRGSFIVDWDNGATNRLPAAGLAKVES